MLTTQEKDLPTLTKIASDYGVYLCEIGRVGGEKLKISTTSGENVLIDLPVAKLVDLYEHAIERLMEEKTS